MDVFRAIEQRRSVKHFDPQHRMSPQETRCLLHNALLAPSAFNLQHWRFVLLQDPAMRQQVRQLAWDQPQITDAALLVIICGDRNAWQRQPQRHWAHLPETQQELILAAIDQYYRDKPQVQQDEVIRSGALAAQNLMLAAKALGYDSCPMIGFDFTAVGQLIELPADHAIVLMVAIGKKTREPWPRGSQLSLEDICFSDRFSIPCQLTD